MKSYKLNNGVDIPLIGLGTYPMNGKTLLLTTIHALRLGYTYFDTASAYSNEKYLGYGLKLTFKKRKDIFISTKLSNDQQREGNVKAALINSLSALKVDYVDLYLIHWPVPETYIDSWKQMEHLYEMGYARAIGVCNFHEHHLKNLLEVAKIVPAVNQIEVHPLLSQKPLIKFCSEYNILVSAYTPLARMIDQLINNDKLVEIANKYNKTVPQIILKWHIQCGIIPIPKTGNSDRLRENLEIFDFELTNSEVVAINNLNCNYRVRHDPDNCDYSRL